MDRNSVSSFEIDDGLEGVDDFTNEPNPFDDANRFNGDTAIASDRVESDSAIKNKQQGQEQEPIVPPPSYTEPVRIDQPSSNETLPPGLLNYYSRYFQLTTDDFKNRLYDSISFKNKLQDVEGNAESEENKTDLYGAIWITATLVMVQYVTKGFIGLIVDDIVQGIKNDTAYDRKETFLGLIHSIWLFYGYVFIVPFISIQILRRDENTKFKSVIDLISVYGYANTNWIPIFIIEDILQRFNTSKIVYIVQWAILAIGSAKTGIHLYKKLDNGSNSKLSLSTIIILSLHTAFSIAAMFILF
ncbi:hypothetical protein Kpol_467p3 [Vanderwaltozyma polyspora DSM 70294]|uniref:Protein YIP n=1 Tax=Vanderwaltozyma polyspora (strain ATCC 22028 / DSM 70294 / BCRC 21397 / CBS 2163 / NBRC 10782 / NRRL Y-8283 / UCD 57-17) TaxID=436907 RepID=A7TQE7_VANPO|nr:uncharacterized protein Kpol_467p3 [Vanderwaltozyma polyspora DSM 70294]EDO15491.1 hypothetical protein Kpol_467p3 [Vanderwaltozyma polyspora DSM 70294]